MLFLGSLSTPTSQPMVSTKSLRNIFTSKTAATKTTSTAKAKTLKTNTKATTTSKSTVTTTATPKKDTKAILKVSNLTLSLIASSPWAYIANVSHILLPFRGRSLKGVGEGGGVSCGARDPLLKAFLSNTWHGGRHENLVSTLCMTEFDPSPL